jgi:hypothetical protein
VSAYKGPCPILGEEALMRRSMALMAEKKHCTCGKPVQKDLMCGCDVEEAGRICCFNRHYAAGTSCPAPPGIGDVDHTSGTADYDSVIT